MKLPLLATLGLTMLGGCAHLDLASVFGPPQNAATIAEPRPARDIPEELLLDVGITIFASRDARSERRGHAEVRRAEANYMAYHLKGVLQATGRWGAVRVVPQPSVASDLSIEASIIDSDGAALAFRVKATDARGAPWFEQEYRATAAPGAYDRGSPDDPFQAAYAALAQDLAMHLDAIGLDTLRRIRRVAELRFARSLAPDAFAKHLARSPSGGLELRRLPAQDDPMLARVRSIRQREHLFIDTLDEYYRDFSAKMYLPYQNWRRATYEGDIARRQLEQEAQARLLLGSASIVTGLATADDDPASSPLRLARIVNGAGLVKGAMDKNAAIQIHAERLRELGAEAEAEIAPHTIELENRTHRLQGTVQAQFDKLQRILRDVYRAETGLPGTLATAAEPRPGDSAVPRNATATYGAGAVDAATTEIDEPTPLPPVAEDVYAGLARAEQHIKDGDADNATAALRELLDGATTRNGNELAQIHYLLGIAHFANDDNPRAIHAFEHVVAQGESAPRELLVSAYFNLARLHILARNYAAALRHLQPGMAKSNVVDTACSAVCSGDAQRKARKKKRRRSPSSGREAMPERKYLAIVSARKLLRAGDHDGAIAFINNALDTTAYSAPGLATILGLLATAHVGKRDFQSAIAAYEQLLAKSDDLAQGHKVGAIYNLAQLHFIEENYEKSLQYQQAWLEQSDVVSDACPMACSAKARRGRRN